jgi:hypothetical protein
MTSSDAVKNRSSGASSIHDAKLDVALRQQIDFGWPVDASIMLALFCIAALQHDR